MKKLRWVLLFILLPFFSMASQVSGYISLKWLGGYTYLITVTDYTIGDPQNSGFCGSIDSDTLRLNINDGNGSSFLLSRINGNGAKGDSVCTCRKLNIYTSTYTFTGPGLYHIWANAGPRAANINNMINSSFQDMEIYHVHTIPPIGKDTSFPVITNPPVCSYGCTTQCYYFNLGASAPAGDSLSYSLGSCLPGIGYFIPQGATINDSGTLKWCPSSKDTGLWNFAIRIVTYNRIIVAGHPFQIPVDTEEVELEVEVQTNCPLGVNEVKDESEKVNVYPNPNNGVFQLVFSHPELVSGTQTIEIYNVLGKKVYPKFLIPNSQFLINISNQPNGIYFYRVLNEDGGLIGDGKLMIVH